MHNIDRPMSERAAADAIGISIHTLRKWRKAGRGPAHFSVSRVIRYNPHDLKSWIAAHSRPAQNAGGQDEQ